DPDEIKEFNANCILMANLQQASTSGTQTDKALVYDLDGSAKNDSNVISAVSSMEQSGGTVEQKIKEEFDKLVQRIDTFVPMDFEATKAKLKRYGEELQTKALKKQKIDDKDVPAIGEKVAEVKEEEPVKRTGKRKKQKARKGISIDKNAQGDSETDKEESVEAMNPTPLATKSNIVVN
ncbi:hypothetical protein Tco_0899656, partial [Tanacetum coccineum]